LASFCTIIFSTGSSSLAKRDLLHFSSKGSTKTIEAWNCNNAYWSRPQSPYVQNTFAESSIQPNYETSVRRFTNNNVLQRQKKQASDIASCAELSYLWFADVNSKGACDSSLSVNTGKFKDKYLARWLPQQLVMRKELSQVPG